MAELKVLTRGPNPQVIELLEDMLERAKSGQIRGIAIATVNRDDCTSTVFELGDGYLAPLTGSVSYLHKRLLAEFD